MPDDDRSPPSSVPEQDTEAILARRAALRVRVSSGWRRLLIAGAAAGAAAGAIGTAACTTAQVCLMPPPGFQCHDTDSRVNALRGFVLMDVDWQPAPDGWRLAVSLEIDPSSGQDLEAVTFTDDPVVTGAALVTLSVQPREVLMSCVPQADATTVVVRMPMGCGSQDELLYFSLDITGTPDPDTTIPVTWID